MWGLLRKTNAVVLRAANVGWVKPTRSKLNHPHNAWVSPTLHISRPAMPGRAPGAPPVRG